MPITFGWYVVEYEDELKPGDVKSVRYFAQDQVLFRTTNGEVSMLDAYCPHLGAPVSSTHLTLPTPPYV